MEWTDDQEQLIDRFLADSMTGEDLKEWEVLMKIPTFRWHVESRKKNFEGKANKEEGGTISFNRVIKPSRAKRIVILIIILILMLLVVFSI